MFSFQGEGPGDILFQGKGSGDIIFLKVKVHEIFSFQGKGPVNTYFVR